MEHNPLLDGMPAFLALDTPEKIAAQRARLAATPVGPSVAAGDPGRQRARIVPEHKPLSSADGRRALDVAALVKLEPRTRQEVVDVLGWHPAAVASALRLAQAHNLIHQQGDSFHFGVAPATESVVREEHAPESSGTPQAGTPPRGEAAQRKEATMAKAKKASKKNKAAAAPAGTEPRKPRALKTDGIVYKIKELVLKDPSISNDALCAALKEQGFSKLSEATVATFRQDFVHSLRFLVAHGIAIEGVVA